MKTKTNKLISLLMCLCMLVGMMPISAVTAFAEDEPATSGTCGESVTWTYDKESGTLTISGTGDMANYTSSSPAPWDSWKSDSTYPIKTVVIESGVTSIGTAAGVFKDCNALTSINVDSANENYSSVDGVLFRKDQKVLYIFPSGKSKTVYSIPNSVTNIGFYAFYGCSALSSVIIPDSVTDIGSYAFYKSTITSITIPNSVTSIGIMSFRYCPNLSSVIIGEGLEKIMSNTFEGCSKLTNIAIGSGVKSIDYQAFRACSSLTSITIPQSVTSISEAAFDSCSKLTAFDVDVANENYSSTDGVLFSKDQKVLCTYPAGKTVTSYTIPNSVTSIGAHAFYYSLIEEIKLSPAVASIGSYAFAFGRLTQITIPASVTEIKSNVFYSSTKLKTIEFLGAPPTFDVNAFRGITATVTYPINQPYDTTQNYGGTLTWVASGCDHSNRTKVNGQAPTCTADGWNDYYKCDYCTTLFDTEGNEIIDFDAWKTGAGKIDATGHTVVTDSAVSATCTANGLTEGSHCSTCGQVITAQQVVPATGHNFGNNQLNCSACGVTNPNYVAPQTTTKKPTAPSGAKMLYRNLVKFLLKSRCKVYPCTDFLLICSK